MNVSIKYVSHLPTVEIIFFRGVFTFFATLVALKLNDIPIWGKNYKMLLARGIFGTIALNLYIFTLQKMPLASATVIQYLSPIFTTILAAIFLRERILSLQWLGFAICFLGVMMLKGFDTRFDYIDLTIGVASALAAGAAYNVIRKIQKTEHPLVIVFYFPMITVPTMSIACLFWWETPQGNDWWFLLASGAATQGAQFYLTKAYQADDASKVSIYTYIGIIYSLLLGYFLFDETFSALAFAGLFTVLSGVLLSLYVVQKNKKKEERLKGQ